MRWGVTHGQHSLFTWCDGASLTDSIHCLPGVTWCDGASLTDSIHCLPGVMGRHSRTAFIVYLVRWGVTHGQHSLFTWCDGASLTDSIHCLPGVMGRHSRTAFIVYLV